MKKYKHLTGISLLIFVGFLVYANSLGNHFQFDDHRMIDSIKSVPRIRNLFSLHPTSRMITQISFYLNYHYRLSRANIIEFHLVNIFAHLLIALLVYEISLHLFKYVHTEKGDADYPPQGVGGPASSCGGRRKNTQITADRQSLYTLHLPRIDALRLTGQAPYTFSLITALLFLAHPLCTESVNYIIARYSLLATMFSFLSFFFFILYFQKRKKIYLSAAVLFVFFSLYSKEIGLVYSLSSTFLYFLVFRSSVDWFRRRKRFIFLVLFFLLLLFIVWRFTPFAGRITTFGLLDTTKYFLNQNRIFFAYLRLIVFPFSGLNVDHYYPWPGSFWQIANLISLVLNVILVAGAIYLRRKDKLLSFACLWVYLLLLPYFLIPTEEMMVEYRAYPVIFGYVLILSWGIDCFFKEKKFRIIVVSGLVGIFSLTTFLRNRVWSNPVDLWMDAVKKSPEKARAHCNLGNTYALLGKLNQAIEEFQRAIFLEPSAPEPYVNLSLAYMRKGGYDSAIEISKKALLLEEAQRMKAKIYLNLATAYAEKGELEEAKKEYKNALESQSNLVEAYYNLGLIGYQEKNYPEAIENLSKALMFSPTDPKIHNSLGIVYDLQGEYDLAIAHYKKAIEYNPYFAEAYYNLGISYEKIGQLDKSVETYSQATGIRPHYSKAYNNLGNIYYKKGEYEKAIENYRKAIIFDPTLVTAYNNLGTVYTEKKMYNKAGEIFKKILEIDPKNEEAKKNLQQALEKTIQ